MKTRLTPLHYLAYPGLLALLLSACVPQETPATHLDSLAELSIEALRARSYSSTIEPILSLANAETSEAFTSLVASYDSDGNRIYTRLDIPAKAPGPDGYPVVILVHGWYGIEGALNYRFRYESDSLHLQTIEAFLEAGFLVLTPALRGHGTVNGAPADGIEFLEAWDNGSYISPMFYAIDVLNLLEGLHTLHDADWSNWGLHHSVRTDLSRISIQGHSQGGDAALTALAVSGEGSTIRNTLASGSIFSGCFGPRFEQAGIYGPMATTLEAFMSSDGSWTGSAKARDGSVNPNFVFGYPSDWIGTVDPESPGWTWQAETWSTASVAEALEKKFSEMYAAINNQVGDIHDARFEIGLDSTGSAQVRHDPRVEAAMKLIGAYGYEQFLTEPLNFHHSDQDYYSIPRWNADITARINQAGGSAVDFTYRQNNHSLLISQYDWFSQGEVVEGFSYMLERDLALFGGNPAQTDNADLTSIAALGRYAETVSNEFVPEYERSPLDNINRRVVSFTADGLKQYALIMEPQGPAPENGWPVLLMNHGYHPSPPDNGRIADGSTDRPGDYYRGLPLAFAQEGFLVVWPDFRGHNISEGLEYISKPDAHTWYSRDVIAALRSIQSLDTANPSMVFMWGHSMGGSITLRALSALGNEVRGASIWSSASYPAETFSAGEIVTPINIHHSTGDQSTAFAGSEKTSELLQANGLVAGFFQYPGTEHLFQGDQMQQAIDRDAQFFLKIVNK